MEILGIFPIHLLLEKFIKTYTSVSPVPHDMTERSTNSDHIIQKRSEMFRPKPKQFVTGVCLLSALVCLAPSIHFDARLIRDGAEGSNL
jgi:hypothetical protein